MESFDTAECFMDELLDFASDIGEEDDDEDLKKPRKDLVSLNPNGHDPAPFNVLDHTGRSLPEFAEEDLEWLSNKDAFPEVETFVPTVGTFVDILSVQPGSLPKQQSPVSVLENSSSSSSSSSNSNNNGTITTLMSCCGNLRVPGRARSKRSYRRRQDLSSPQSWWIQENVKYTKPKISSTMIGRKCQHCGAEKTPQWRAGPHGPKTLCNACGVRYKSGRLVPEYRPASSPTFSNELHSNSHRKIIEMRKQKQMMGLGMGMGMVMVKPVDKG